MPNKLTLDEIDEGTRKFWDVEVKKAVRERDRKAEASARDAYECHTKGSKRLGKLVAEFDMAEYLQLKHEYGEECMRDPDFIHSYQKFRGQTFLPKLSKRWA